MPQAAPTPTTSRRGVLAAAGAASFATGLAATAALPDDRDARLIALLAEFNRLEHAMVALGDLLLTSDADERRQAQVDEMEWAQHRLYPLICAAPTHTMAGFRARAHNLALWAPDLVTPEPDAGWDQRFVAAILRDLARLPG